jgi:hypothetical protein
LKQCVFSFLARSAQFNCILDPINQQRRFAAVHWYGWQSANLAKAVAAIKGERSRVFWNGRELDPFETACASVRQQGLSIQENTRRFS